MAMVTSEKYLLTLKEASEYFSLGIKKLRRLAEDNMGEFSVYSGNRYMIVRQKFEEYLLENPLLYQPEEERVVDPKRIEELREKDYLTPNETIELFGLSRRKFYALMQSGPLDFTVNFRSRKFIIRTEFEKYLEQDGRKETLANGKAKTRQKAQSPS